MRSRTVVLRKRDKENKILYSVSIDIREKDTRIQCMLFEYSDMLGGTIIREESLVDDFLNIREAEFEHFGFSSVEIQNSISLDAIRSTYML